MNFPSELKYTKDHEWIRIDGNIATVGITDFAQKELGDIVYVDLKSVGTVVDQHGLFGTVEAVKTVSDLYTPVSCKIIEINTQLSADASVVNSDPYGKGWMIKIEISKESELAGLLSSSDYQALVS